MRKSPTGPDTAGIGASLEMRHVQGWLSREARQFMHEKHDWPKLNPIRPPGRK